MLLIAATVGLLIGVSLGAFGAGGSILTVPALVYLLGQSAHAATTGSLVIVGVTALISLRAHARAGHVRVVQGTIFAVLGSFGTYAGSYLSARVNADALLAAFSVVIVIAASAMLVRLRRSVYAHAATAARSAVSSSAVATADLEIARPLTIVATATGVGMVTGFFGVGGGFVVVPALVLALGYDMPVAVGTSLLVIAVNSATALATRAGQLVTLDWPVVGGFAAVAVLGSLVGARATARIDQRRLTIGFVTVLYVVAGYTGLRSGAQLL